LITPVRESTRRQYAAATKYGLPAAKTIMESAVSGTYTRAGKEKLSCIVASEERDRVCPEVITDIDSEILKSLRLLTIEAARAHKLLQLLSIGSGHGLDRQ
jgi:hypothetical protein